MILEGMVTTCNADGSPHLSPMGPIVDEGISALLLRPFTTSHTYANLARERRGVFHVTDDVELIAQSAVGQLATLPPLEPCPAFPGYILADCCRWFAFEVASQEADGPKVQMRATVIQSATRRDFFGFNRAKHAVLEAAILATRLHFLPPAEVGAQMRQLAVIVQKTAGPQEARAFAFLQAYVSSKHAG